MHEGMRKRFEDIEKHVGTAKVALELRDPEAVLSEVRKLNVYVQDLLVMAHRYKAEEQRAQENQREGGAPRVGEQEAPRATGSSPPEP